MDNLEKEPISKTCTGCNEVKVLESKHELPERFKRLGKTYWNVIGVV
jgi:hypothetical protein